MGYWWSKECDNGSYISSVNMCTWIYQTLALGFWENLNKIYLKTHI